MGARNNIVLTPGQLKPGQPAKDSFRAAVPSAFKDNTNRFYYEKDDVLHLIAIKKKGILEQFSDRKNELKKFMKTENIDLTKEKDVVALMNYYSSLTTN